MQQLQFFYLYLPVNNYIICVKYYYFSLSLLPYICYSFICPSIHQSIHLSTHPFFLPLIHLNNYLFSNSGGEKWEWNFGILTRGIEDVNTHQHM
jgi:hypothetical protein